MKITKLISVFERLLPIYKEAYEKEMTEEEFDETDVSLGICNASLQLLEVDLYFQDAVFEHYYGNIKMPPYPKTNKDLKPRIDFMEREIKSLKRLMKKGYTHV